MEEKYFDVDEALKDHSADQVAAHLAQLFGIDREAYLKDGKTDAQFLGEYKGKSLPAAQTQTDATPTSINEPNNMINVIGGGAAAAVPAIGRYAVNKLGDVAKSTLGLTPNTSAQTAPPPVNVQKQFVSPEAVQQRIINSAKPARPSGPSDVVNWSMGKESGAGQYGRGYLGGANMEQEAALHKRADALEASNPGRKIMPGTSSLLIPEEEYNRIVNEKAAAQTKAHTEATANAADASELRKQRLAKTQQTNTSKVAQGALNLANKPLLNRFTTGYNTADLLQAENPFEAGVSAVGAAAPYVTPKIAKMVPPKYRGAVQAAGVAAQYGAPLVNFVERKLLGPKEEKEEKAAGGLIQHYDAGSLVKGANAAKKAVSGYLHHTAVNPNPLVGTRFEVKDLGGLAPVKPMDLEDIRGHMIHTKPWDLSARNRQILSVSGKPLTTEIIPHGGQGYVRDLEHIAKDIGGASALPISNKTQKITDISSREGEKLGGTGQVTMTPSTMAKFSEDYAVPTFDTYKNLWDQAEPGAARTQAMLEKLRFSSPIQLKTETPIPFAGMVKDVKYPFRDLKSLDFNDPEVMDRFLKVPDLRKAAIKEWRSKENQKMMDYNAEDLSAAHTDPDLLGLPPGFSGHTMIEMRPGSRPSLSSNLTYDTDYAGKYSGSIGHTPTPVLLNKAYSKINQEMRALHPNADEDKLHRLTMGALYTRNEGVSDLVNDEMINRVGAFHEAVKQNKIDPHNVQGALQFLAKPGAYAEGGEVPHLAGGGDPLKGANVVKHSISQIPKVAQALEEYLKGNITKAQHMEAVRKHLPIRQWNELPPEYTDEQIRNALRSNQLDKALAPVPVGKETGNRLDINAYTNNNPPVFVDTVHDINDNNKVLSYNRTGHLKDVNFKSLPNSAVMMGLGTREQALTPMGAQMGKSKAPIAMIEGTNVGTHDDEVRRMMAEMIKDPRYTQIGMDPRVGSQFYDKSTDRPIWTSGEKFQVGPLVMVPKKDIETTDWNDPRLLLKKFPGKTYKKGGLAALKKKK